MARTEASPQFYKKKKGLELSHLTSNSSYECVFIAAYEICELRFFFIFDFIFEEVYTEVVSWMV